MGIFKSKPPYNAAIQKAKSKTPRDIKEIEQDYANASAKVGDQHFKCELERGKLQQLTMEQAKLRDEHEQAKEWLKATEEAEKQQSGDT